MKKKLLNLSKDIITKRQPNITDDEMAVITYGLESIYLTITKLVVLLLVSIILGITREFALLLIIYNVIRSTAFGMHASNSTSCLIASLTIFIGGVYVCEFLNINILVKFIICIFCLLCVYKYAPADTHKRPIVNHKKRKKFKIITLTSATVLSILVIVLNEHIISNYLLYGMFVAVLMILPAVYKIFKMPYNNYKNYKSVLANTEG